MVEHLKIRGYRHIGVRPPPRDCQDLATSKAAVERHGFLPLLSYTKKTCKRDKETKSRVFKARQIMFAAHKDAAIYELYSKSLGEAYEARLGDAGLQDCVVAYRKGVGSNVEIARRVFEFIGAHPNFVALCFDVTDFFGSLIHRDLKGAWRDIRGVFKLDLDDYQVFRSVTKFAHVDREDLRICLGIGKRRAGICVRRRRRHPKKRGGRTSRRTCGERQRAVCLGADFRALRKSLTAAGSASLVKVNRRGRGIPQGLPISAILSNLYMFNFDNALAAFAQTVGGCYRRYSDDIIAVVPKWAAADGRCIVRALLAEIGLAEASHKFQSVDFGQRDANGHVLPEALDYLGLTFDGVTTAIRAKAVARHFDRLARAAARYRAKAADCASDLNLHATPLFKRFTDTQGTRNFATYARGVAKKTGDDTANEQLAGSARQLRRRLKLNQPLKETDP